MLVGVHAGYEFRNGVREVSPAPGAAPIVRVLLYIALRPSQRRVALRLQ